VTDLDPIGALTKAIEAAEPAPAHRLFKNGGLPEPQFQWNPSLAEIDNQMLRSLAGYWQSLREDERPPLLTKIDALAMKEILGFILLVDTLDGGADFRYRVYGSKVADLTGEDFTGFRVSQSRIGNVLSTFLIACYKAVVKRPAPLLTCHQHMLPRCRISQWTRLMLPLRDNQDVVSRILVGCVPTKDWPIDEMFARERGAAITRTI
jgi:hypothetical protein